MTQEQRINSEIEAASKRIDAAYANDPGPMTLEEVALWLDDLDKTRQ